VPVGPHIYNKARKLCPRWSVYTDKEENKIFLIYCIRKFRMKQLQSHRELTASSYLGKYLRISSYLRKPFLINDFATDPF
jgi:hypothetical protein